MAEAVGEVASKQRHDRGMIAGAWIVVAAAALAVGCGGGDGGNSGSGGGGGDAVPGFDVDELDCEEVLPLADVASITGFPITDCTFGNGFVDDLGRNAFLTLTIHPSDESAAADFAEDGHAACEFGDGISGQGWSGCDGIFADAIAGRLLVSAHVDAVEGDDSSSAAAELENQLERALIDAIVARHGG